MRTVEIFETIQNRKSIRSYKQQSIPEEILVKILDSARLAPSAGNKQPWHFIVVNNKEIRSKIAKGCRYGRFLDESPIVIVACGDKKNSLHWYAIDTAIALEHLVLTATALGLGTCWIGLFNEADIKKRLQIPENYKIVALVSLGYPQKKVDLWAKILHLIRPKKKLSDIISIEVYGKKGNHPLNM